MWGPPADRAFPVTLLHARAPALSTCQVSLEKAWATSECPDQLGKLLGQAAECIYTLISSLTFIKHPLPAREEGMEASRYRFHLLISHPPHPSPRLPPDMGKASRNGLAWTGKRAHSQFHLSPSSNTTFWNPDTCPFGSDLNRYGFLETPFLLSHSLPVKIVLILQGPVQGPASSKNYPPGDFQTLSTESFHFPEPLWFSLMTM